VLASTVAEALATIASPGSPPIQTRVVQAVAARAEAALDAPDGARSWMRHCTRDPSPRIPAAVPSRPSGSRLPSRSRSHPVNLRTGLRC
jgi:hypothetical protein